MVMTKPVLLHQRLHLSHDPGAKGEHGNSLGHGYEVDRIAVHERFIVPVLVRKMVEVQPFMG